MDPTQWVLLVSFLSQELMTTWGCPGAKESLGGWEGLPLTQPTPQGVGQFSVEAALGVGWLAEIQPRLPRRQDGVISSSLGPAHEPSSRHIAIT